MNKIIISAVIACGLLLLDSPEAAAHEQSHKSQRAAKHEQGYRRDTYHRDVYRRDAYHRDKYARRYRDYYRHDYVGSKHRRAKHMPSWLKRDRRFRNWFEHTRLRRNRHVSWHVLYDIYRWEQSYFRYRSY